ncbi:MAG: DUF4115 domain-containing protein [Pseudomonadales bacterium]|jgi:cytoskeletal protein RodZ|nr:DUF4115 domain-containing protein [Pseudomonadales bacterium]
MTEHDDFATLKDDTPRQQEDTPRKLTPGAMVRAQRERDGLSLQKVKDDLYMTIYNLKLLENDDYAKLPSLTHVQGYFRKYADYLGMDVDAVLASYEDCLVAKGLKPHVPDFNTANMGAIRDRGFFDQSFWALVSGAIVVITLIAGWWFFGRDMEDGLAARTSAAPPIVNTAQATPAAPVQNAAAQNAAVPQSNAPAYLSEILQVAPPEFPQSTAQSFDVTVAPNVNDSQQAATDAGVAVINATLEARQEEKAQLENNAQAAPATAANTATAPANAVASNTASSTTSTPAATTPAVTTPVTTTPTTTTPATTTPATTTPATTTPPAATTPVATAPATTTPTNTAASDTAASRDERAAAANTPATASAAVLDGAKQNSAARAAGGARITLRGPGNDWLNIQLYGDSWAEIYDAHGANLFNDALHGGDQLSIQGTAPFNVRLGDARLVEANFNEAPLDIRQLIRPDNTVRFSVGIEGDRAVMREQF